MNLLKNKSFEHLASFFLVVGIIIFCLIPTIPIVSHEGNIAFYDEYRHNLKWLFVHTIYFGIWFFCFWGIKVSPLSWIPRLVIWAIPQLHYTMAYVELNKVGTSGNFGLILVPFIFWFIGVALAPTANLFMLAWKNQKFRWSIKAAVFVVILIPLYNGLTNINNVYRAYAYIHDSKIYNSVEIPWRNDPFADKKSLAIKKLPFFTTLEEVTELCNRVDAKSSESEHFKQDCIKRNFQTTLFNQTSIHDCLNAATKFRDSIYAQAPTARESSNGIGYPLLYCLKSNDLPYESPEEIKRICELVPTLTLDPEDLSRCTNEYARPTSYRNQESCRNQFADNICELYEENLLISRSEDEDQAPSSFSVDQQKVEAVTVDTHENPDLLVNSLMGLGRLSYNEAKGSYYLLDGKIEPLKFDSMVSAGGAIFALNADEMKIIKIAPDLSVIKRRSYVWLGNHQDIPRIIAAHNGTIYILTYLANSNKPFSLLAYDFGLRKIGRLRLDQGADNLWAKDGVLYLIKDKKASLVIDITNPSNMKIVENRASEIVNPLFDTFFGLQGDKYTLYINSDLLASTNSGGKEYVTIDPHVSSGACNFGNTTIRLHNNRLYAACDRELRVVNLTNAPFIEISQRFDDYQYGSLHISDFIIVDSLAPTVVQPTSEARIRELLDLHLKESFQINRSTDYENQLRAEINKLTPKDTWALPLFLGIVKDEKNKQQFWISLNAIKNLGVAGAPAIPFLMNIATDKNNGNNFDDIVKAVIEIDPKGEKLYDWFSSHKKSKICVENENFCIYAWFNIQRLRLAKVPLQKSLHSCVDEVNQYIQSKYSHRWYPDKETLYYWGGELGLTECLYKNKLHKSDAQEIQNICTKIDEVTSGKISKDWCINRWSKLHRGILTKQECDLYYRNQGSGNDIYCESYADARDLGINKDTVQSHCEGKKYSDYSACLAGTAAFTNDLDVCSIRPLHEENPQVNTDYKNMCMGFVNEKP